MMKAVTAAEMRNIDRIAIEQYAVPGEVLMAYAGRVAANYIDDNFPDASSISVFCGTGNNGGDGFVVAWLLANRGRSVRIFLSGSAEEAPAGIGNILQHLPEIRNSSYGNNRGSYRRSGGIE